MNKSLLSRKNELSDARHQLQLLSGPPFGPDGLPFFSQKLKESNQWPLRPSQLEVFQMNVGYMCNQTCAHCHVDAGPDRKEIMTRDTMSMCLDAIRISGAKTVDITGGAPEMNPDFKWLIEELVKLQVQDIIVRCNLTIITANKKYFDLPDFFAKNRVHVVSSLPFYEPDRTDRQRGQGVFSRSIDALRSLNAVGYGQPDSGLRLDLVYNPAGAFLPASQAGLEADFKKELKEKFDIHFNQLFCITNLPISRFLDYLLASENFEDYMDTLVSAFNPAAVSGVMCRNTLSVGWEGTLYHCDFNQMLKLPMRASGGQIRNFDVSEWQGEDIIVSQHCYGCTAGAGSSCQGTTI